MGKPDPPAAPDPARVAALQNSANLETATANAWIGNANEIGPQGNVTYTNDAQHVVAVRNADGSFTNYGVPSFTRTTTLSPAEQTKLNQQNQLGISLNNVAQQQTDKIGTQLNTPVSAGAISPPRVTSLGTPPVFQDASSYNGASSGPVQASLGPQGNIQQSYGPTDYSADRKAVEDALYSRVNPQLDRDRNALETKLVNQGLVRGTTAFSNAMDESNRQANDARMQVVAQGGQEQTRLAGLAQQAGLFANNAQQQGYDQSLGAGQFANTAQQQKFDQGLQGQTFNNEVMGQNNSNRQKGFDNSQTSGAFQNSARDAALQETLALRNQPINEISALMAGGQVNIPQFAQYNAPTVANTDIAGNYYNTAAINQQNFATQQSGRNALIGGLAGLGGAGLFGLAKK